MPICIYSKEHFEKASAEHVLQNFLGARWVSSEIASDKIQQGFSSTIDKALELGLMQIRNLLGTEGGRGGMGPRLEDLQTASGRVYDLEPGGKPRVCHPLPRGKADHFIGITTANRGIQAIIQFFGNVRHSIRLAEKYEGPPFDYSYIVDPFREASPAEVRDITFKKSAVPPLENQLLAPNKAIGKMFREGISNVHGLYLEAANADMIDRVIKETWGHRMDR